VEDGPIHMVLHMVQQRVYGKPASQDAHCYWLEEHQGMARID